MVRVLVLLEKPNLSVTSIREMNAFFKAELEEKKWMIL
jgi:hypothetical protein